MQKYHDVCIHRLVVQMLLHMYSSLSELDCMLNVALGVCSGMSLGSPV